MTGPFDFLHIKGRTAGSSNELSFDVLDAARSGLDDKKNRSSRTARPSSGPRPSQGSYQGVGGTSTLSAVPEVERRKRARRVRRIRSVVVGVVLVAALVAAGGFAGYRFYQDRMDFASRFDVLIGRFVEVDQSLVEIDALMGDPLNSVEADERSQALDRLPRLEESLDGVVADARSLESDAGVTADASALEQAVNAAVARKEMIAAADDAFTLSVVVNKQITAANGAWSKVLSADEAAREASAAANAASDEKATEGSRTKTQEAIDSLTAARAELAALEKEVRGIDFSGEIDYIETRIEALESAVATSDALLANDREAAVAANDAYNVADRAAATKAARLDASISNRIKAKYADDMQRYKDAYDGARTDVIAADSALRAYAV